MKYVEYKTISLYDAEAMEECNLITNPDYEIFPGWFLKPCGLGELVKAIDLDELGTFDYAVPRSWAKACNYPKGLDQAVWLYRKRGDHCTAVFGDPFTVREMLERLREKIKTDAVIFWLEQKALLD